jgi:hypothetical protein
MFQHKASAAMPRSKRRQQWIGLPMPPVDRLANLVESSHVAALIQHLHLRFSEQRTNLMIAST